MLRVRKDHPMKDECMIPTRVLIVDDVASVRRELAIVLGLTGIEVAGEAENGLEAIHQAEALRPDVILMDLEMPVMDGWESARQIKLHCPECRIIALTIHDSEESRERCAEGGMDAFFAKGASLDALLQAIRQSGYGKDRKEGDLR